MHRSSVDFPQPAAAAEHHTASGWDAAADFLQGGPAFLLHIEIQLNNAI